MKVTICDMCGEVFKASPSQENTIGYINYDLCKSCINRIQREMKTQKEDYEDRLKNAVSGIVKPVAEPNDSIALYKDEVTQHITLQDV